MNSKKEKLLNDTYYKWIQSSLYDVPLDGVNDFVDAKIMGYGSAIDEKALSISDYRKLINRQREQAVGLEMNFEITPVFRSISNKEDSAIFVDEIKVSIILQEGKQELFLRLTTILEYINSKWIVVHWHGSIPTETLAETDTWLVNEWKRKNEELEKLVDEKTIELVVKNRELEIETALEKVRAVAMSMHKSDDLLSICEVSFKEFKKLGFDNIRNAVIHILNDEKVFFLDYDYSDYLGGSINSINYNSHPVVENYLEQIKISDDAFAEVVIEGQQLDSWKDFRRSSGQLDDPTLDGIPALFYYLYSIGVGDIGISTFNPINESQVGILKRFRNVFDLAYRRYTDITKAEAQAREAKIEASLEKVRASAMSMHKSDDLLDVCEILYKGLNQLGFDEMRNTMINIHNDEKETFINYDYSDAIGRSINHLTYNIHPVIEKQIKQIRSTNDAFSETSFTGKDLEEWKKFRNKIGEKDDPRIDNISALYYYFYSIGTGSIGISTFSSINEEKLELLKRFRNVFSLSYQRYLDIALAEAQAREAEIQLALERVRARSLAMHHTSELQDMVNILAQQLYNMNLDINGGVFIVINAELDKDISLWASGGAADYVQKVTVPFLNSPIFIDLRDAIKRKNNFFTEERTDKEKIRLFKHLFKYQPWNSLSQKRKEELLSRKGGYSRSVAISQYTSISITNHNGKKFSNDENEILKRFGNVFEQSYTRFLDLQKAEAQAREAKIEASLERVRAVAMSMLKSDELLKVCESVFNELRLLGFNETDLRNTQIVINNDEKEIYNGYQYSDYTGGEIAEVPYDMHPIIRMLNDKLKKSTDAFADIEISGKAMDDWKAFVKSFPQKPDEKLYNASELHYYFYSVGIGALGISSFKSLQEEQLQILQRLRNVFNLSYQRYSDIALAEAQAREAQIELALERVRARTMAMYKSEELSETAHLLFQQFKEIDKEPKMLTIGIMNESEGLIEFWVTDWSGGGSKVDRKFNASIDEPILLNKIYKAWKKKQKSIVIELSNEELLGWVKYRISLSGIPDSTDYSNSRGFVAAAFFSKGILSISTYEPHSPETVQLLEKFAGVFNLTYTRFLDLQKAEAQAREAQIETSMEKIRSRSLAMQKPKELVEVAELLRKEMGHLGVEELETSSIYIVDKENQQAECWYAIKDIREENKRLVSDEMKLILSDTWVGNEMWKFYRSKNEQISIVMKGDNRKEWINYCADKSQELQGYYGDEIPERTYHLVKFNGGYMGAASPGNISAESWDLLRRAASVFSLAYTRFKDLQDAEASAREAQIEAALERVRSRSMGMQKSEELKEVIRVVYEQFVHLKINVDHAGFVVDYTPKGDWTFWIADERDIPSKITHPYFESVWANQFNEAKEKGADFFATNLNFEEKNKFYNELLSFVPGLPEASKDFYLSCPGLAATTVLFDNVSLYIENFSGKPYTEEENKILMRFGKVFQQTYTRFLDLQKAEAQAREAKIEAALERTRAQSMMMQHSKELDDTLRVFHEQVLQLGIPSAFSYLWLPDEEKERHIFWAAWAENNSTVFKSKAINYPMDRNEPATAQCIIDWKALSQLFHIMYLRMG
ncbi:MAG: nuclear transport factor 2 family protein [Ignavibacteriales bacterium]|nr:nuclear transport factor 2 family protein [Ignavibacteriales bacterium]